MLTAVILIWLGAASVYVGELLIMLYRYEAEVMEKEGRENV
jgi:hypothetical protein